MYYSDISAIYGKKIGKNLNASLQKEDKLTDTCAVTMFGSLPSIFSITSSSAPVIQLARSHKSFNVRCFFSFGTKGQKPVSQMGLFSLPTNLHFSQTWNLKFYPNSNEIKSGQGSQKDVRSFPFFSSKCFPPKNTVETSKLSHCIPGCIIIIEQEGLQRCPPT